mmetsp:Transcript_22735/g.31752  ORF Transcript_22735/g.31752 Transcript_22735/m.31752 type:complete len:504 (+) Transcript_22735:82-1593(+)
MIAARVASRKMLVSKVVSARTTSLALRTLRTSTSTAATEDVASASGAWKSAAGVLLAAGGLVGGATTLTMCEQSRQSNVRDPNTIYAQNAAAKQMAEDNKEDMHVENMKGDMSCYAKVAVLAERRESEKLQRQMSQPRQQAEEESAPAIRATSAKPAPDASPSSITEEEQRFEEQTRQAKKHSGGLKLFSGNGNMALASEIARFLGINLGKATVGRFADGEVNVMVHENVRGKDTYIIQPTCPPVNDNIMELLLMVSTLRRASARRITVVIPYYGYARQDRKMQARVPISAADVARLLESMGIDRVIAVDLHCGQIQGFFGPRVPVDNLDGGVVGLDYFGSKDLHNPVVVSPDAGGVYRAKKFKEGLAYKHDMQDIGLAMIIKQRARAGTVDQMDLVGDVTDCDCIIVDDMIDTAGTLCKAADVLVAKGARRVFAFASHGLLSGPGNDRIANSKLEECVILNTIPTSPQREANEKLTELSVAPLLAQTIFNIHAKKSISALFK